MNLTTKLATAIGALCSFLVQPMLGKALLPHFGGTSTVWMVCLMFFQCVLFLGYLYTHLVITRVKRSHQAAVHICVLAASFVQWPLSLSIIEIGNPTIDVLASLLNSALLPFFVVTTTAPLVQAWGASSQRSSGQTYSLYAVSNLASFAALALYPGVLEPAMDLNSQQLLWSWLFVGYVASLLLIMYQSRHESRAATTPTQTNESGSRFWNWTFASFTGNFLLLAATNHLCMDVASVPLLWTAPLAIFLCTYVIAFSDSRLNAQPWVRWFALSICIFGLLFAYPTLLGHILTHLLVLGCGCMVCHTALYVSRPPLSKLTHFYFAIALGGLIAGITGAVVVPRVFNWYGELYLALFLCLVVDGFRSSKGAGFALSLVVLAGIPFILRSPIPALARERNFFGVVSIIEETAGTSATRSMIVGHIRHGSQILNEPRRPTSYFCEHTMVGRALSGLPEGARVGIVGLGTGTLAAYGRPNQRYTFFEINPLVLDLAQRHFTFLRDSQATVSTTLGDGRRSIERLPNDSFDVLIIDAFSGDSIPMHLLTLEAFELYLERINSSGIVLTHISNAYLDLRPVLASAAATLEVEVRFLRSPDNDERCRESSWAVMSPNSNNFPRYLGDTPLSTFEPPNGFRLWTDRYSNLLSVLGTTDEARRP